MKQRIGLLLGSLALIGMIGCSDKSDDGSNDGGAGKLNQKSVIGQASKIGYFPDGTKAEPLSDQQMAEIGKTTEGAMSVNKAVANVTPKSLQRIGDAKIEAVQAFLQSSAAQSLLRTRASADEAQQFEQDLRNCIHEQSNNQPVESGDNNTKYFSLIAWNSMRGTNCPLESRMDLDVKLTMVRVGEKAAKVSGGLTFKSRVDMLDVMDQATFDFVNEGIQGRVDGEAFTEEGGKTEVAANGTLKGQLQTKTQGNIEAEILFDIYLMQLQTQQGYTNEKVTANGVAPMNGEMRLALAVILKTNSGNLLLQLFAQGTGDQATMRAYLNGKELSQASQN